MKNSNSKRYLKLTLLIVILNFNRSFAQVDLNERTYKALVSTTCKEMIDGGCTIKTYCIMSFKDNIANISYYVEAYCTPKEKEKFYEENIKKYKKSEFWSEKNHIITIKNFNDYGNFIYTESTLIGKKEVNGKLENLVFEEI